MSRGLRVAVFGDGAWAADTLSRLQHGPHEVAVVVLRRSPSDGTLEAVARSLGLPVLQPLKVNTSAMADALRGAGVELGLSVAYDQIFRPMLLEAAPLGFLNLHAGMLPFYRGRNVINWALINGEREIGVTVHFLDQGVDTGDILLQRSCRSPGPTPMATCFAESSKWLQRWSPRRWTWWPAEPTSDGRSRRSGPISVGEVKATNGLLGRTQARACTTRCAPSASQVREPGLCWALA